MKKIYKVALTLLAVVVILGILYQATEVLFPRDFGAITSLEGTESNGKILKEQTGNHYYISFTEYNSGKKNTIKIVCSKEQYNFIVSGTDYHILYRENYFNRKTGTILQMDSKPIYNGNQMVA